tara:strand:+ start:180707 stop:181327 length:621 start_codon:yes stop_codon:yes gene_type:complete
MIYAFLSQKGGVGKTTLSIHTADELSRRRRRVLLVDADPQGSALSWSNGREKATFSVIGMPKATLHKEIESIAADYDDVVIDAPPRAADIAKSIILASDVVVIPLQPSPLDVWEATKTLDLVREAQVYRPSVRTCLVVNRKIANTAIGRDVRHAMKGLDTPLLKAELGQRVGFAETAASGSTVLDKRLSKAAQEVKRFVNELRRLK